MKTSLSAEFRERIKQRIGELEKVSSVEFVPVITDRSASYAYFRAAAAVFCTLVVLVYFHFAGWGVSTWGILGAALAAGVAAFALLSVDAILCRMLPSRLKHEEVEEAARLKFLEHEVFATAGRTGVLIFISELERSVYLLEDKGIAKKVDLAELTSLATLLAKDLGQKGTGETFLKALSELSSRLAKDFPPDAVNPNDLTDNVRG